MARKQRSRSEQLDPTAADLAAIEREWPLIAAELALLDAQVRLLSCEGDRASRLEWRRLRRAEQQVLRAAAAVAAVADVSGRLVVGVV